MQFSPDILKVIIYEILLSCYLTCSQTSKQRSKRLRPSEAEQSSKKQRISHIKNNNNIIKDPVDKNSSHVDKSKLTKGKETESLEESVLDKKEDDDEEESSLTGIYINTMLLYNVHVAGTIT